MVELVRAKTSELEDAARKNELMKEKIQEFHTANQSNIRSAQEKLLMQQQIIEKANEESLMQQLENKLLKDQIQAIDSQKFEQAHLEAELSTAREHIKSQGNYISEAIRAEERNEQAAALFRLSLMKRVFCAFRESVSLLKERKLFQLQKRERDMASLLLLFFSKWHRHIIICKIIAGKHQWMAKRLVSCYLKNWRKHAHLMQLAKKKCA